MRPGQPEHAATRHLPLRRPRRLSLAIGNDVRLKGFGRARGVQVGVGEVVNGSGDFDDAPVERQRHYHPNAPHLSE
ncbi:hypothetical protein GCM10028799_17750 [Kribbella italica]